MKHSIRTSFQRHRLVTDVAAITDAPDIHSSSTCKRDRIETRAYHHDMPSTAPSTSFESALQIIESQAAEVDQFGRWPKKGLDALWHCGAFGWALPSQFGGCGMNPVQRHKCYQRIAAACLTTALILTQRDAAIEFLSAAEEVPLARRLLRRFTGRRSLVSIGISQVTTSTRLGYSAVTALPCHDGFRVNGIIPWATSAHHCTHLVAAADAGADQRLLFILPMNSRGVAVQPCRAMAVLNGSDTAPVKLTSVLIRRQQVLAPPSTDALRIRARRRRFTLNTCVLPLGVARGALDAASRQINGSSRICRKQTTELRKQWQELARQVYESGMQPSGTPAGAAVELRARCNHMAMRCALASLELAKGRGLQADHAAQRRVREAMFFFVWSSPNAVIEKTLAGLAVEPPIC